MAITVTQLWKQYEIAFVIEPGLNTPPELEAGLFTNNHTPTNADDLSSVTEPTVTGYARIPYSAMVATGPTTAGDTVSYNTDAPFTFDAGVGSDSMIYGWFLNDLANNVFVGADTFSVPFAIPPAGGSLDLLIVNSLNQLPLL